jgi:AcrR family transcriptional regulator
LADDVVRDRAGGRPGGQEEDPSGGGGARDRPRPDAPRATRRRGRELLDAIHEAVLAEAAEVGLSRLSMEGVARRAGTAKTSLYRRWPTPGDILIDAMYHTLPQEVPTPGADDLRGDLVRALMLLRGVMVDGTRGQAMFAVVAEARHHPDLYRRFTEEVFDARGGRFTRTVLEHYAGRGRIDPARVTPLTVDIGEAMMIKYGMDHQAFPDEEYVARIVDEVILPAVGQDPRDGRPSGADPS